MAETVTKVRFFTIADFKEEEVWLRDMARSGLHFLRMYVPCFYVFEKGEPQDVIYRLDFTNNWRRSADELASEAEGELFSDDASRLDMVRKVVQTRMLPLLIIFFCCVLPNLGRAISGEMYGASGFFLGFFGVMTALYLYLFIHCGGKLRRMRRELEKE